MRLIDYLALLCIGALLAAIVVLKQPAADVRPAPPPASPAFVQELPDALVNAPPERTTGPDGHFLIDHSAGW